MREDWWTVLRLPVNPLGMVAGARPQYGCVVISLAVAGSMVSTAQLGGAPARGDVETTPSAARPVPLCVKWTVRTVARMEEAQE